MCSLKSQGWCAFMVLPHAEKVHSISRHSVHHCHYHRRLRAKQSEVEIRKQGSAPAPRSSNFLRNFRLSSSGSLSFAGWATHSPWFRTTSKSVRYNHWNIFVHFFIAIDLSFLRMLNFWRDFYVVFWNLTSAERNSVFQIFRLIRCKQQLTAANQIEANCKQHSQ